MPKNKPRDLVEIIEDHVISAMTNSKITVDDLREALIAIKTAAEIAQILETIKRERVIW